MKETRYFYVPDIKISNELPPEEAHHAMRVLRLREGDEILITDGKGHLYEARLAAVSARSCQFAVDREWQEVRTWQGGLHVAMAPTKNADRTEWAVEKMTEIGIDHISFMECDYSERRKMNLDRLSKILVSAVKQSHKAYVPQMDDMCSFSRFIAKDDAQEKFIAHCYDDERLCIGGKPFLLDALKDAAHDVTVLIGPEGDFSVAEVEQAIQAGYQPIALGKSRLRTETAALAALHIMNIHHRT
ncbi:MAG: 16S rRNA (uracil(1498)-N(3))-methyltransferase [Bacteroidaceae bacterium]|nr:16S rRNA (uracil(1498)-N(3))-methyltransferase [Bacteroidaceae bacterium]